MNVVMNVKLKGNTAKSKGLTFDWTHLKTQTNMEISWEKKDRPQLDFINDIAADVDILDAGSLDILALSLIVGDVQALGKIINRAIEAFARIDVIVEPLDWAADSGLIEFEIKDGTGADIAPLIEILARMLIRATTKFSNTQHPLSTYDLKQTCGFIKDASDKLKGAQETLDWMSVRELVVAEGIKEEKAAAAKEKREVKKAETAAKKAADKKAAKATGAKKAKGKKVKAAAAETDAAETDAGDTPDPN